MAFSNVNGYDILKQAEIEEDNKESQLKSKITAFLSDDNKLKEKIRQDIKSWMKSAKSGLSLNHETYVQSLCAIFKMLDNTAYQKYIEKNNISVNLNKKQQLNSNVNLKVIFGKTNKLCKFLYSTFFYSGNSQAVQLLRIWKNIINEFGWEKTDDLRKLKIKGEKFIPTEKKNIELKDFKFGQ
ncbi:MAG: hypothetical protein PVG30_01105 [Gammaproteobacteria bacterium]